MNLHQLNNFVFLDRIWYVKEWMCNVQFLSPRGIIYHSSHTHYYVGTYIGELIYKSSLHFSTFSMYINYIVLWLTLDPF